MTNGVSFIIVLEILLLLLLRKRNRGESTGKSHRSRMWWLEEHWNFGLFFHFRQRELGTREDNPLIIGSHQAWVSSWRWGSGAFLPRHQGLGRLRQRKIGAWSTWEHWGAPQEPGSQRVSVGGPHSRPQPHWAWSSLTQRGVRQQQERESQRESGVGPLGYR